MGNVSFEIICENLTKQDLYKNYFHFMKYAYKYKNENRYSAIASKYNDEKKYDKKKLENDFPFFEEKIHEKFRTNIKYSNYPLEYYKMLKNIDYNNFYRIDDKIINRIEYVSNIFRKESEEKIKNYIDSLIPGSFIICQEFELLSPYFSKDDDEFYIIDNPIIKEKVCKVPMIRGSTWKGSLLDAAFELLKKKIENNSTTIEEIINLYKQLYRVFGTGSEEFRDLKDIADRYIKQKSENGNISISVLEKQLVKYALFELGINLYLKCEDKPLVGMLIEAIDKRIKSDDLDSISIRKGRTVFYPTYFDRITLEVINPHNRKTKAGTSPIYFEVVPRETRGHLQIIYIPFDAVLLSESEITKQVVDDINFLKMIIEKTITENGIGAKTKLGWGYARLIQEKSKFYCNIKGV